MSTSGIRAGRAFVELGVNDQLTKAINAAQRKLSSLGSAVQAVGAGLIAVGTAAAGGMLAAVHTFTEMGSTLNDMSERTGASVESLSELGYAAKMTGSSAEDLEKGIRLMGKVVTKAGEGSSQAADALGQLGLSFEDLQGLAPDAQMAMIADGLKSIKDPAARATAALGVFGRGGASLLPMLKEGAAGLDEFRRKARELGLSISGKDASAADEFGDALDGLWMQIRRITFGVGASVVPVLSSLLESIQRIATTVIGFIDQNRGLVAVIFQVAAGVAAAGVAIVGLGIAISATGAILGGLVAGFGALSSVVATIGAAIAFLMTPIGWVVVGVAALGAALVYHFDAGAKAVAWLKDAFAELSDFVGPVFQGIYDAMANGDIQLAAEILWAALKTTWLAGVAWLQSLWGEWGASVERYATAAFNAVKVGLATLLGWIVPPVITAVGIILNTIYNTAQGARNLFYGLADGILSAMSAVTEYFSKDLVEAIEKARKKVEEFKKGDNSSTDNLTANIAGFAQRASDASAKYLAEAKQSGLAGFIGAAASDPASIAAQRDQANQAALDAARTNLADLIKQAADARNAPDLSTSPFPADRVRAAVASAQDEVSKITSRGTFNASAIQGLAGGGAAMDKIAGNTKQTAENTKNLLSKDFAASLEYD